MKILKDVLDERSELTVREISLYRIRDPSSLRSVGMTRTRNFEIFSGGKPSTTRLVAMLYRNDRFVI